MTYLRTVHAIALFLCVAILAGCSSTGTRKGGYYKDDGPGSNIPADIEAIPDAVPRLERHAKANFRPYVVFGKRYVPVSDEQPFRQEGTASWYGRKFHGKKTANGEIYDMYGMSAAHPTLPIPSYARITRASTGKSVIVRINDRGPFHSSRIIDLSYVAAAKLGLIGPGSGQVVVEAITNADIRNNTYGPTQRPAPAPAPIPIPPAAPEPERPLLIASATPAPTPNALDALQHEQDDAFQREQPADDIRTVLTSESRIPAGPAPDTIPGTGPLQAQPVAATGGIYLQFGAFSASHTADTMVRDLNARIGGVESRKAHVQPSDALYRVRIGPYPSRTAAVNAALRIQEETGMQASVALR